jgi:hypothetical protein
VDSSRERKEIQQIKFFEIHEISDTLAFAHSDMIKDYPRARVDRVR